MTRLQWPLWFAGVAALAWLGLGIAVIVVAGTDAALPPRLVVAGALMLALAAPVAVIALVALRLADSHGVRSDRAAALADAAWQADHRLDEAGTLLTAFEIRFAALADQLAGVAAAVAAHDARLAASIVGLDAGRAALSRAADAATASSNALATTLPAATVQATALQTLLTATASNLHAQLGDTETLLAALWVRIAEIAAETGTAADAAANRIDAITAAAAAADTALSAPIAALDTASRAALTRSVAAVAASGDAIDVQAQNLATHVEAARTSLHHIGDEAAGRAEKHLARLQGAAAQLTGEIDHQSARYAVFIEQLERGFAALDARLVASVATGKTGLDSIAAGMVDARDALQALAAPIDTTRGQIAAVAADADAAAAATVAAMAAIDSRLPDAATRLAALTTGLAALHDRTAALGAPIDAAAATITAADTALVAAQTGLETAARRVADELAAASAIIAEIENRAGGTAMASAAQLADVFGRVRDVATQTAGTMRASLSAVVDEAEAALATAGTARADAAFGSPVRAALADLAAANTRAADAGQAAAERITTRLLALTTTIASVERRLADADAAQDQRVRDDIAARSTSLLASMNAAAIDIAGLLSAQVDEAAWARWLAGDRGLFLRRAIRLVDARTSGAIAAHWAAHSDFREVATRFIGEFESLIARVGPGGNGRDLALTLLSSDPGKLYVALSQSIDRLK